MSASLAPVWFITGCSTGFGRELVRVALAHGCRVVATARNERTLVDLGGDDVTRLLKLPLDVTDARQSAQALASAHERFGRIDVLVNNAGYGYLGAVEESEEQAGRELFETNFFGLVRLTQAVLPGMRARRSGCIVNMSSIGGLVGFPAFSYYNASKFAVEGFSEVLHREVSPLGLRVLLVEPGPYRTDFAGRSLRQSPVRIADYEETAGAQRQSLQARSGHQPGDPARAAQAIIQAVESPQPPLRLVLGRMAVDTARAKLRQVEAEIAAWESVSLATDYPSS